jgi:hypothetical protein
VAARTRPALHGAHAQEPAREAAGATPPRGEGTLLGRTRQRRLVGAGEEDAAGARPRLPAHDRPSAWSSSGAAAFGLAGVGASLPPCGPNRGRGTATGFVWRHVR